ncbi:cyclic nucleotide-binding domain-containing protein [Anaeromicropila herbilytica]|uniref:Cyclic nucleotide-binding domain-containing protein n=1 Tax=Anaeromicropila herbilytica TaxID=2785025 RepID=A0A7R7ICA4_9FIRM|nr:cyclic nucleotide-binding domain-containing protein [Anaeromicropila herbilytica]BCN28748.1 hypothetical protein bsdtb5_00430 [Anaeromicropila herbilytica]
MGVNLNPLTVNQIPKGTIIYSENEQVTNVCLVVKGRVLIGNSGSKIIVGTGSFIGISDLYTGSTFNTYIAYEDVVLYAFPVSEIEDLEKIYYANKDYRGLAIGALSRYVAEYDRIYQALNKKKESLYNFITDTYARYIELGQQYGVSVLPIDNVDDLAKYESDFNYERNKIDYYQEYIKIPMDILKAFYATNVNVTTYQVEEQAVLISDIVSECVEMSLYIVHLFEILINSTEACLFKGVAKLAIDSSKDKGMNKELISMVDEIKEQIFSTEKLFIEKIYLKLNSYNEFMEEIYINLLSGVNNQEISSKMQMKYSEKDTTLASSEMENSLKQILDYSRIDQEEAEAYTKLINEFKNLRDKYSSEDTARMLRKRIAEKFYNIYERVFIRAYEEKNPIRIIDMFLNYGYMDEELISKEQSIELYFLKENNDEGLCNVYTMKDWLIQIYEKKKEPSKNEFDLDYVENLREIKKSTKLTPEQEKDYLENPRTRVNYEIMNMFRYNNRLVNGQMSIFVPILYEDGMAHDIGNAYLTAKKVNDAVAQLLKIDYSVFHRESLYYDEAKGIKKEYIMEAVYPDMILLPMYGQRSIMWQEITGKKRNTKGRFLLPAFIDGSLEDHLIRLFGQFRWELCRCIQGASWNDIKNKSLTSEYSDYIQFYRKNRDLSEDRKEKIKSQIQKGRHNTREIFVIDYEIWIKNESNGAVRLNKVAREIIANYCPFSLEIRNRIGKQPVFQEAIARFDRNQQKKIKELDLRLRALEKERIPIPDVLIETQKFYRDL